MKRLTFKEWLDWRRTGVGTSDAAAIMGASPWATIVDVFNDKAGKRSSQKFSPQQKKAMNRGLELEPKARAEYQRMTGIEMPSYCVEHVRFRYVLGSLDGLNDRAGRALEIKCPGKKDHAEARAGRIPRKYIWQLVHILLVTGFDRVDYFSFDGKNGVIIPFHRDEKKERQLLSAIQAFWACVESKVPPPGLTKEGEKVARARSRARALGQVVEPIPAKIAATLSKMPNVIPFPKTSPFTTRKFR